MRRSRAAWSDWLAQRGVVALEEVDTRALVRRLREDGAMRCALGTAPAEELHARALAQPHLDWPRMLRGARASPRRRPRSTACVTRAVQRRRRPARRRPRPRLQALDRAPARRVRASRRSSSRARGTPRRCSSSSPRPCSSATGRATPPSSTGPIETVRELLGRVPLFGICLGHQLVGLALGLGTFKLPFGHRGANHPVRVTGSKRVLVTAQNHGFAVEPGDAAEVSHVSLNDGTVEGLRGRRLRDAPVPPRGRARPARRPALLRPDRRRMPKRTDLRSILIVGSGPIRIGQGCEFDYAGVQACRALRAEGYRVVLANSNPATIMTDPEWADATYLEPLDAPTLAEIVARERPDALLPTLGGQTALNLAVELAENGVLAEHGVELIGADLDAIRTAEDRSLFRAAMDAAGLPVPASVVVTSLDAARRVPGPGGRAAGVHARRPRRRDRPNARRAARARRARPRGEPDRPGARRALARGLAGVRARGRRRHGRATASSSARSRTSIPSASTPATRGRSRRSRRFPTASCSGCATPRSPVPARSASPPAAPTSSSPTSRRRASCS